MWNNDIKGIIDKQRTFFHTNGTKNIVYRKLTLRKLLKLFRENEERILGALYQDLGKSKTEGYMTEVSMVYTEIEYALKKISRWAKPQRAKGVFATFPSKNYIYKEPYGVVLILAPWNYPFQLSMIPLVGAIAAGNTAIIKCSKSSIHTSRLICQLINENFGQEEIYCVEPDIDYNLVLEQKYDYIFFTGSPSVGKTVMKAASENLTPVSLELGGKSPCFVDKTANLKLAARRIAWGKFLNSGQTCIAIDYILVDNQVKEKFLTHLVQEINQYEEAYQNQDWYPVIINQHHFNRLTRLIQNGNFVIGGESDAATRKIAPAIFPESDFEHEIMEKEIFGPILPVIGYDDLGEAINQVKDRAKPLACYIFTEDGTYTDQVNQGVSYGGGCINDVLTHVANHHLPFGGVGNSGMGRYHGKYSFETFSHQKAVTKNTTKIDLPFRYPPYTEKKLDFIKKILE